MNQSSRRNYIALPRTSGSPTPQFSNVIPDRDISHSTINQQIEDTLNHKSPPKFTINGIEHEITDYGIVFSSGSYWSVVGVVPLRCEVLSVKVMALATAIVQNIAFQQPIFEQVPRRRRQNLSGHGGLGTLVIHWCLTLH